MNWQFFELMLLPRDCFPVLPEVVQSIELLAASIDMRSDFAVSRFDEGIGGIGVLPPVWQDETDPSSIKTP